MSSKRVGIDGRLVMFDSHFLQKESPSMGSSFYSSFMKVNIFYQKPDNSFELTVNYSCMILIIVNHCNPYKRGPPFFVGNDVLNVL